MKLLIKKEWKLTVTPVPLLFLLLSALVLVPSYPYYVTFFYNALGIFLMLQAARENRDVYYMALLPLTKRDLVRARFSTIVTLQLLQALVCVPFMLLRSGYAEINNPVGIEANLAFLGFGFMLMGLFDLVFLPMHYKNGYDLGKPFVISSIVLFFAIVLLAAFVVRSAPVERSSFYSISAASAVTIMLVQTLLNVFGTVDILPLTGVTFPFVSNGGSSMLCVWGLLAFIKAADTRQNASFSVKLPGRED